MNSCPPLKAIAAEERVRDDSEALLDEASYHAARAERFVRTPLPDSEPKLEAAFLDYFRALSDGKGVSRQMSADGSEVLWCLRPDDVRPGELTIVDKDAAGELGKRIGTFRRALAPATTRRPSFLHTAIHCSMQWWHRSASASPGGHMRLPARPRAQPALSASS